jgi:hypothetical protein
MNFGTQLVDAPVGFRTVTGFSKGDAELECCHCGKPTAWFHVTELLYFCCDECYWRFVIAARRRGKGAGCGPSE